MSKNPLKIKVAYLYPDLLQGFCDKANLDVLKFRAKERDIEVEIEEIKNDDKINSAKYDFYYISGTNIEMLDVCSKKLLNNYTQLNIAAEALVPMLAINCGYILFGKTYQLSNSTVQNGLSIFNAITFMAQNPKYNKIVGTCDFLTKNKEIAGFIKASTETVIDGDTKPFLTLKNDKTEGARYNNVIGTYITSPLLAHNPYFCDYLLSKALQIKYKCQIPLTKLTDDIEWYAHNYLVESK